MTPSSERRRQAPLSWRFLLLSLALAISVLVDAAVAFGMRSGPFKNKIKQNIAKITGLPSSTANTNNQQQQSSPFQPQDDDDDDDDDDELLLLNLNGDVADYDDEDEDELQDEEVETDKPKRQKRKGRRRRIKKNEKVVFFPTAARRSEDGTGWDVPIHGWIYEPVTRDPARR